MSVFSQPLFPHQVTSGGYSGAVGGPKSSESHNVDSRPVGGRFTRANIPPTTTYIHNARYTSPQTTSNDDDDVWIPVNIPPKGFSGPHYQPPQAGPAYYNEPPPYYENYAEEGNEEYPPNDEYGEEYNETYEQWPAGEYYEQEYGEEEYYEQEYGEEYGEEYYEQGAGEEYDVQGTDVSEPVSKPSIFARLSDGSTENQDTAQVRVAPRVRLRVDVAAAGRFIRAATAGNTPESEAERRRKLLGFDDSDSTTNAAEEYPETPAVAGEEREDGEGREGGEDEETGGEKGEGEGEEKETDAEEIEEKTGEKGEGEGEEVEGVENEVERKIGEGKDVEKGRGVQETPQVVPSMLSIPSMPSMPSMPSIPPIPPIPPTLSTPSTPSTPSLPSMPSMPAMPSMPSMPSVPSIPSIPSIPPMPSITSSIPSSSPTMPSVSSMPPTPSIPSSSQLPLFSFSASSPTSTKPTPEIKPLPTLTLNLFVPFIQNTTLKESMNAPVSGTSGQLRTVCVFSNPKRIKTSE